MKFQKILDVVIDFADKGLFDDVYWYIKDFKNYELLICVQDNSVHDADTFSLDNNLNTVIAKINSHGFTDYFDHVHHLVTSKSFEPEKSNPILRNEKYNYDEYNLGHTHFNDSIVIKDEVYSRKVDEAVLLMILRHPLYNSWSKLKDLHSNAGDHFRQSVEPYLCSPSGQDAKGISYDYYLYFMSSIESDSGNYYNCFLGIDIDEFDSHVSIISNSEEEEFLSDIKKVSEEHSELVSRIKFLSDREYLGLKRAEQYFIGERKVNNEVLADYHKIMEICASKYWQLVANEVISYLENMEKNNNERYVKSFARNPTVKLILRHRTKEYHPLNISAIHTINSIITNIFKDNVANDLPESLADLINNEQNNFYNLSTLSGVRNDIQHRFEEKNKSILTVAVMAYRFVIVKLLEMIETMD